MYECDRCKRWFLYCDEHIKSDAFCTCKLCNGLNGDKDPNLCMKVLEMYVRQGNAQLNFHNFRYYLKDGNWYYLNSVDYFFLVDYSFYIILWMFLARSIEFSDTSDFDYVHVPMYIRCLRTQFYTYVCNFHCNNTVLYCTQFSSGIRFLSDFTASECQIFVPFSICAVPRPFASGNGAM